MNEVKGWTINGVQMAPDLFGRLDPDEILYSFDDYQIFITYNQSRPLFVYTSVIDWDTRLVRFLVTPTTNIMIDKLKRNDLTICDMLRSPWLHIVDADYIDGTIIDIIYVDGGLAQVPEGFKPVEGTLLNSELEQPQK